MRLQPGQTINLSENDIKTLCIKAKEIFLKQSILLELGPCLNICGDIHGQFYDLLELFKQSGGEPQIKILFF